MKELVLLMLIVSQTILADPWPPQLIVDFYRESRESCKTQLGMDEGLLKLFESGEDFPKPEQRCFFKCLSIGVGTIRENGALDTTMALKLIEQLPVDQQNIFLQAGRKCLSFKQKDLCEKMYAIYNCLRKTDPVHFFI